MWLFLIWKVTHLNKNEWSIYEGKNELSCARKEKERIYVCMSKLTTLQVIKNFIIWDTLQVLKKMKEIVGRVCLFFWSIGDMKTDRQYKVQRRGWGIRTCDISFTLSQF